MIIRRHRFDRFGQSDCPGSGSCHQALAWRLSSGLPRPRRVLPGITPSSNPLTTNPLVDGQGRGARSRARLSTPGYPSTDDPPGSAQVAEPNRPHCPPASKPARSGGWLVPPSMCAAWLVPSRHRDTATEVAGLAERRREGKACGMALACYAGPHGAIAWARRSCNLPCSPPGRSNPAALNSK